MKIGKQPKRFGGPSAAFLARKGLPVPASRTPRPEGPVDVFLDDERPCPPNWIHAKTPSALFALIDDPAVGPRIRALALDWHLGAGVQNGEEIASVLSNRVSADPAFLPALKLVTLHSSDRERAISMARTLELAYGPRDVAVHVCSARETAEMLEYLG